MSIVQSGLLDGCIKSRRRSSPRMGLSILALLLPVSNSHPIPSPVAKRDQHRAGNTESEIHIFITACGGRYPMEIAASTMSTIRSIYFSSTLIEPVHVHITHDADVVIVRHLLQVLDRLVDAGMIDEDRMRFTNSTTNIPKNLIDSFKRCATSRLMIAEEHPDIDVGIYIDIDTYVLSDIHELYWIARSQFGRNQWSGFTMENENGRGWYKNHNTASIARGHNSGVNTGVWLFDARKWRMSNFTKFWKGYNKTARLGDQDIINEYFYQHDNEIYVLPCEWNSRSDSECSISPLRGILHGNRGSLKRPYKAWWDGGAINDWGTYGFFLGLHHAAEAAPPPPSKL